MVKKCIAPCALALFLPVAAVSIQLPNPSDHDAIAYSTTAPTDSIADLQQRIDSGEVNLEFVEGRGYLASLLRSLDIPVNSQGLVFSRTSLQVDRIAPWAPRAIYFNDNVYVGWVQGSPIIEIASVDPKLGAVFYTLPQDGESSPQFKRETAICLMCHDSSSVTGGVPGFILRSVYPDRYGYPVSVADRPTTDRTPIESRWGGWYVTGTGGRHSGNTMASLLLHEIGNVDHYLSQNDGTSDGNVIDLSERFDTSPYLSPGSDAVALLVLAHQTYVHNLITSAGYEARKALHDEAILTAAVDGFEGKHLPTTLGRVERATEPLVRGMLFVREAPFPGLVEGTTDFARDFAARGPHDSTGRSLRELDLERRLFRYPLSFLIYSQSFDALPDIVKDRVYVRLGEVLTGADESPEFAPLSMADRKAVLEILTATKEDFRKRKQSKVADQ